MRSDVDALHMVALVAPPEDQVRLTEEALAVARASDDPRANDWDASLLNNLGMALSDAGDWNAALAAFEEALAARERIGDEARTRVARWMVGWALRNLGRTTAALAVQRALKADLDAAGAPGSLRRRGARPPRGMTGLSRRHTLERCRLTWRRSSA